MNTIYRSFGSVFVAATVMLSSVSAQNEAPSAKALAERLSNNLQDGNSEVRLKIEIPAVDGNPKTVLQLKVKSRRDKSATELVYQVLWPKERKGEGFLLKRSGSRAPGGTLLLPPNTLVQLTASKMKDGIFGSDLTYADLVEDFFSWSDQKILGSETVGNVPCVILESKPGSGNSSIYAKVQSWIDTKRMVPLRVDKYYGGGKLARRIETTRVAKDDSGRQIPASFSVMGPDQGPPTILEGSSSKHEVTFSDSDFTQEAIGVLK